MCAEVGITHHIHVGGAFARRKPGRRGIPGCELSRLFPAERGLLSGAMDRMAGRSPRLLSSASAPYWAWYFSEYNPNCPHLSEAVEAPGPKVSRTPLTMTSARECIQGHRKTYFSAIESVQDRKGKH